MAKDKEKTLKTPYNNEDEIFEKIHSTFASVAASLGYNEVHGRILSALLIAEQPMSLNDLCKSTGYSPASVSLSLDLLELVGIVKKVKLRGDRKLYAKLEGDLLHGLRNALIFKLQKEIASTLLDLKSYEKNGKAKNAIIKMEREVKRLEEYVNRLSKVEIPKK
ncbi:MAG: ArsR family transcriptional regulator [Candidatus Aenigmarchaeota archaeon]|nr:ArsR family transcriptional regulator [Candidatus Aenigmarchaeota archaeon]